MKKNTRKLGMGLCLLGLFAIWTLAVCVVDIRPIGPQETTVGFAGLNQWVHGLTGVNMALYALTDWLSLVPVGLIAGFALLGLIQWMKRKRLRQLDHSLLLLGGFYLAVLAVYALFEYVVINYRPVLIEGVLEASYPSSTTMLVLCVMPTAMLQVCERVKNRRARACICWIMAGFTGFMVAGRLLSGVHWITDIIGGALLSAGLVLLYDGLRTTKA